MCVEWHGVVYYANIDHNTEWRMAPCQQKLVIEREDDGQIKQFVNGTYNDWQAYRTPARVTPEEAQNEIANFNRKMQEAREMGKEMREARRLSLMSQAEIAQEQEQKKKAEEDEERKRLKRERKTKEAQDEMHEAVAYHKKVADVHNAKVKASFKERYPQGTKGWLHCRPKSAPDANPPSDSGPASASTANPAPKKKNKTGDAAGKVTAKKTSKKDKSKTM